MKTSILAILGVLGSIIALILSVFTLFEAGVIILLASILDELIYQRNIK
ncbi:hypothetical protein ACFQ1R_12950 [Mariniflexile jejuense]|uniref:Uncharacterized protein n=1 Tax=Mariniflexile jejuense TaxID=1173582 RepID=A0ABW3JKW8_9FLAO